MCLTGEVAGTWHLERENLESSRRPRWDDQTNSSHHSWLRGIWDQCILAFEASAFWHLRPVHFGIWDQCILAWEASALWHLRPVHFGIWDQCILAWEASAFLEVHTKCLDQGLTPSKVAPASVQQWTRPHRRSCIFCFSLLFLLLFLLLFVVVVTHSRERIFLHKQQRASKDAVLGTYLVVHWLRLRAPNAGG